MLRVTLELVPRGDERAKTTIGVIEIANVSTTHAVEETADYAVTARGVQHADATLRGARRTVGWRMVMAALRALFGEEGGDGHG